MSALLAPTLAPRITFARLGSAIRVRVARPDACHRGSSSPLLSSAESSAGPVPEVSALEGRDRMRGTSTQPGVGAHDVRGAGALRCSGRGGARREAARRRSERGSGREGGVLECSARGWRRQEGVRKCRGRRFEHEGGVPECSARGSQVETAVRTCSRRRFEIEGGGLECSARRFQAETGVRACSGRRFETETGALERGRGSSQPRRPLRSAPDASCNVKPPFRTLQNGSFKMKL